MELQPQTASRLASMLLKVASNPVFAKRFLQEPLFAKVYGAFISCRFNNNEELRSIYTWLRTKLSQIKPRIQASINKKRIAEEERSILVQHLHCIDRLIDDSKKDFEAVQGATAELEAIVHQAVEAGLEIQYLASMKRQLEPNILKKAIRQVGAEGFRSSDELGQVLRSLYITCSEQDAPEGAIAFCLQRPRSVRLAIGLLFKLFGLDCIVIKGRALLLLCLRLCYNMEVASSASRDGVGTFSCWYGHGLASNLH